MDVISQVGTDFKTFWPKNDTTTRDNMQDWLGTRTWKETDFLA